MEHVTVVGNLVKEAELRITNAGTALANFSIAVNRKVNDEEKVSYYDVTAWRELAENVATLSVGTRVIVTGRLEQQTWDAKDGSKRSKVAIIADEVGPSLRWATVSVQRTQRSTPQSTTRSKALAFDDDF